MSKEQKQTVDPREGLQALNALGDALEHLKNAKERFDNAKNKNVEVQDGRQDRENE